MINSRLTLFIFAFILMAVYLFPMKYLFGYTLDSGETWKAVTTFFSSKPYATYMYKGLFAFLPNIVLYNLSIFLKLDQFFFVKLFQ